VVGVGSVLTVVLRGRRFNWRTLGTGLMNAVWAAPVLVALAFVTTAVAPHFGTDPAKPVSQDDVTPPWAKNSDWNVTTVLEWPSETDWTAKTAFERTPDNLAAMSEWRVVLESEQFADVGAARKSLAGEAAALVQADFVRRNGTLGLPTVSPELLQDRAVVDESVETVEHELAESGRTFEMVKVRWLVELSESTRQALQRDWQAEVSQTRFGLLAGVVGLLTVVFGVLATYFRLDLRTDGEYRKRLKLGTVSLIVAAALGFVQLMQTWLV
jgi:hypothetical protein